MRALPNDIFPNDAQSCRQLAKYFEEQARQLSSHADALERAQMSEIRNIVSIFRSGKIVRCLEFNQVPVNLAIRLAASRTHVDENTVRAQYEFQKMKAEKRALERREREIIRLSKKGFSLRKIALSVGLSRSRVHQILARGRHNQNHGSKHK